MSTRGGVEKNAEGCGAGADLIARRVIVCARALANEFGFRG